MNHYCGYCKIQVSIPRLEDIRALDRAVKVAERDRRWREVFLAAVTGVSSSAKLIPFENAEARAVQANALAPCVLDLARAIADAAEPPIPEEA